MTTKTTMAKKTATKTTPKKQRQRRLKKIRKKYKKKYFKKSRMRETPNLSTAANSSTNIFVSAGIKKGLITFLKKICQKKTNKKKSRFMQLCQMTTTTTTHPPGQFGLVVSMSVYMVFFVFFLYIYMSPWHAILPGEERRSQRSKAVGRKIRCLPYAGFFNSS